MKTQFDNLRDFAQSVVDYAADKADYKVNTSALTLDHEDPNIVRFTGSGTAATVERLKANATFHAQVADRLGIPKRYYDRMLTENPGLLSNNVNSWWHKNPETRLIRAHKGTGRAYLSDRYGIMDHEHIVETVLPVLAEVPGVRFEAMAITQDRMHIKIVSSKLQAEVSPGDVIQLGLAISNSETGAGAFRTDPLTYRLVCKNGMISLDQGFRANHTAGRDQFEGTYARDTLAASAQATMLKARDAVKSLINEQTLKGLIAQYKESQEQVLEVKPALAVERLEKTFSLSSEQGASVLEHLIRGGDMSRYGVIQALTRASQDVEDYDAAHSMEVMGGKVLNLKQDEWRKLAEAA